MCVVKRGKILYALAVIITILAIGLLWPYPVLADTDLRINICDPDNPNQKVNYEGSTINSALSTPQVSFGQERVLGTVRITGKPGIAVPVMPGQKIMITLPQGTSYMQIPRAETYTNYVEWPAAIDGKSNQIVDDNGNAGIKFIAGTPRSLTVEVTNIDTAGELMLLDFVFDKEKYSTTRLAPFVEVVEEYSADFQGQITRLDFVKLLHGVSMPFSYAPLRSSGNEEGLEQQFSDISHLDSFDMDKLRPFIHSGLIQGNDAGLLRPDDYITRAEAVALIGRVFKSYRGRAIFIDQIPAWAQDGIDSAYAANIVCGYPDGSFRPERLLTKLEAISILQRSLETYACFDKPRL